MGTLYGYIMKKKYFETYYRCLFLLKLKVTKIPIQNRAKIGPNRKNFSFPAIAVYMVKAFLDAHLHVAGNHAHHVY